MAEGRKRSGRKERCFAPFPSQRRATPAATFRDAFKTFGELRKLFGRKSNGAGFYGVVPVTGAGNPNFLRAVMNFTVLQAVPIGSFRTVSAILKT